MLQGVSHDGKIKTTVSTEGIVSGVLTGRDTGLVETDEKVIGRSVGYLIDCSDISRQSGSFFQNYIRSSTGSAGSLDSTGIRAFLKNSNFFFVKLSTCHINISSCFFNLMSDLIPSYLNMDSNPEASICLQGRRK